LRNLFFWIFHIIGKSTNDFKAQQIKNNDEVTLIGSEYTLFINTDEVMIRANNLAIETDEILEDDFHYYDEESIAFCGTTDFIHFLNAYFEFIA